MLNIIKILRMIVLTPLVLLLLSIGLIAWFLTLEDDIPGGLDALLRFWKDGING